MKGEPMEKIKTELELGDAPLAPLRKEDAVVCEESQLQILKKLHDVQDEIRKAREQAVYWDALTRTGFCFLQGYRDGKLSLILNFDSRPKSNAMTGGSRQGDSSAFGNHSALISYDNIANHAPRVTVENEQVFVKVVDFVKKVDGFILPSLVRLYLGHHELEERLTPGIYLDAVKGIFKAFPSLINGEFPMPFMRARNVEPLNSEVPCHVQSTSKIVNGIPDDERKLSEVELQILGDVCDLLNSSIRVTLNCRGIVLLEREESCIHISDMLIGPLDFHPSVETQVCSICHGVSDSETRA